MSAHHHYFHFVFLSKTGRRHSAILKTKHKLFPITFVLGYLKEATSGEVTSSADITDIIEISSDSFMEFVKFQSQQPLSIVDNRD